MKVTDKSLVMDGYLVKVCDMISERISKPQPKLDYAMLIGGDEGYGKSNIAASIGYYIAGKTGRNFDLNNVFFDTESLLKFATTTENQIIMWDEMALNALSMSVGDKWQIPIVQTLMMARKKRHLFLFCIPRFYRLKEQIIERSMGLIQVYPRKNKEVGNFMFFSKSKLDSMYEKWKKQRTKPKYWVFKDVYGTFGESISKIVDEDEYELKKDKAIEMILEQAKQKEGKQTLELRYNQYILLKIHQINGTLAQVASFKGVTIEACYNQIRKFEQRHPDKVIVLPNPVP